MRDRESLERENEMLRGRVTELQRRLSQLTLQPVHGVAGGTLLSLQAREELLIEAERIAHLGTLVWDPEADEVYWSQGLFRMLGYDSATEQASAAAFFAVVHPDDLQRAKATSERGRATSESQEVESR